MAARAFPMNPIIRTEIGNPMINKNAPKAPIAPTSAPVGIVVPVMLVTLAMAWDTVGIEPLRNAVKGVNKAAKNKPMIKAQIASIIASISENEIIGTSFTSLNSIPSFIPPNRDTKLLYSKTPKKLTAMLMKKVLIGYIISKDTPIQNKNAEIPLNWGINAAIIPKAINITIAPIKAIIA